MSKKISPKHFIFYFLIAAIHLAAIVAGSSFEMWVMITKPLLIPALIIVYYRLTRNRESEKRKFVFTALIFSWMGDSVLLFQESNPNFFLIGLVCFLLAHVSYILAFLKTEKTNQASLLKRMPWLILFFIVYAAIILMITKDGLGAMLVPVIIYMCIILLMGLSALNRFGKVSMASFISVFAGAIFFMLSDSLLAINKFSQPIFSASFLIMLTYILAQYFIVKGMIKERKGG